MRSFLQREVVREQRRDGVAVPCDQLGRRGKLGALTAADTQQVQLAKRERTDS